MSRKKERMNRISLFQMPGAVSLPSISTFRNSKRSTLLLKIAWRRSLGGCFGPDLSTEVQFAAALERQRAGDLAAFGSLPTFCRAGRATTGY
jgi:hypothetical protein